MVTILPQTNDTSDKGLVISWPGANSGDVGQGISTLAYGEMTHGSIGTFTTVTWKCSLDGGTTWAAIGAGHTDTVSGASTRMAEHPYLVRPEFTTIGGATTAYLTIARAYY